ncbi:hypothetical protein V5799_023227, partial [Amblyomma americanum]
ANFLHLQVDLVVGYGPVANISHLGPPLSLLIPFTPVIAPIVSPFTRAGYVGLNKGLSELLSGLCNFLDGQVCSLVITITAFSSPYQLNETRVPMYVGHFPLGTTLQNLRHYYQVNSDKFQYN